MVEESQPHLGGKDPAGRFIDHFHGDLAFFHCFLQLVLVNTGTHVHIHTCQRRLHTGIQIIRGDAMVNTLADGIRVAHHKPGKAQLLFQNIPKQEFVHGTRNTVQIVEGCHDRLRTGIDCCLERFQIMIIENMHGHVHRVVIPTGFTGTVADIVLQAGRHIGIVRAFPLLQAGDFRGGEGGSKAGILTGAFGDTSPPGIAGDIQHRRKMPGNTGCLGFSGRHAGSLFHQIRIKGSCFCNCDREDSFKSMDDIQAKDQRDAQPAFFHRDLLQFIDFRRILHHEGPYTAGTDIIFMIILRTLTHDLAELFL